MERTPGRCTQCLLGVLADTLQFLLSGNSLNELWHLIQEKMGLAGMQKLPESTGEAENACGLWSAQRLPGSLVQLEPQLAAPGTAGQAAVASTWASAVTIRCALSSP